MKKYKLFLVGILATCVFVPQSVFSLVSIDIGVPVTYASEKNEKITGVSSGQTNSSIYEDKLKSSSGFILRGNISLLVISAGLGISSLKEEHTLTPPSSSRETVEPTYKFDTTIYELMIGIPLPIVDFGFILGAGTKKFTFDKTSFGSKSVSENFPVIQYGLYGSLSIDLTGPLDLRVGASYQVISGVKKDVNITDAITTNDLSVAAFNVNPSATYMAITLGIGF